MKIASYSIRGKLSQGKDFTVYRAIKEKDKVTCVLKILEKKAARDFNVISAIKNEYHHLKQVNSEYILKAVDWIDDKDYAIIVLEDINGNSLKDEMKKRRFPIEQFIDAAIKITTGLAAIHSQNIIHKDINPANIIWDPQTGRLKIIDFSIATKFDIKISHLGNPEKLQGTLPYISPEQTGRMNRRVDHRTDLYSLGVTFYEILTAQLPFGHSSPMEIVYAHLAKDPEPPHLVNEQVPLVLSKIILKLLAKNPEERYQSAEGLQHDLEKAIKLNFKDFKLGEKDFSGRLQIPEKLYGRGKEVEQLLKTYQRASKGAKEIILVTGYSGTGKTALVNEIHKPITKDRGYFISGKFDRLQGAVPYFAITQALNRFCQLLLTEKEDILAKWRERILKAVGALGKVLTDIIPQLGSIIGEQPDVPEAGGEEAKKRFNYVFQCFLRAISNEENPLVLFIDDLQWADFASLDLLKFLMEDRQNHYLLFIGAYRDNEVSPTHPLVITIEDIQQQEIDIHIIPVKNLSLENVQDWLQDTLKLASRREVLDLADLIYNKTQGNAFFTIQFLENLYREKLLSFDFHQTKWSWNIKEIQKQKITDNVVDLLARKIKTFSTEVQDVLKLAACIGSIFHLHPLNIISGKGKDAHQEALQTALSEHMVYPLEVEGYKFVHDRIHQAAYSLISDEEKKPLHLKIGRLLLKTFDILDTSKISKEKDQKIFDIVNHLNIGIDLIEDEQERIGLARLNLKASRHTRASAAYKLAADYVHTAIVLLTGDCWHKYYDLTLEIYNEAVQTSFLCGNYEEMENFVDTVLKFTPNLSDKTIAYEILLQSYITQNKPHLAAEAFLSILNELGVNIPKSPSKSENEQVLHETQEMLRSMDREEILNLPRMSDPEKQLVLRLFASGIAGITFTSQELLPFVISKMVGISLKYGLTPETPFVFTYYAIISNFIGDTCGAYQASEISMDLLNKMSSKQIIKARAICFNSVFGFGWKLHFKEVCKRLIESYQYALNSGDFEYVGISLGNHVMFLCRTDTVPVVKEKLQSCKEKFIELDLQLFLRPMLAEILINSDLSGQSTYPAFLDKDLKSYTKDFQPGSVLQFESFFVLRKIFLAYFFEDYTHILEYIEKMETILTSLTTPFIYVKSDFHFYIPLAYLQLYTRTESKRDKETYLSKVNESIKTMKGWAEFGPVNFLHKYYLMQAELYRVSGQNHEAAEYYDKAVEKAYENEYINEAALANELAAKFYMYNNRHKLAALYFMEARDCYRKWGTAAKVKHLEENYPKYLSMGTPNAKLMGTGTISSASTDTSGEFLDVKSIIKASQILSGEVQLARLLKKMMQILVENAGAQKSVLIEYIDDRLLIQAEGTADGVSGVLLRQPVEESENVPLSVINYVARSEKKLVFDNIFKDPNYSSDDYIKKNQPKSVVCFPIIRKEKLSAIIYLENNLVEGAFTPERMNILNTLSAQIAISIENARIYRDLNELNKSLEQKVAERTRELEEMDKAKSRFFANISHEFRTPLTLIMGPLEQILSDNPGKEMKTKALMMLRNSRRLLNLINQLLELARLDSGKMKLLAAEQNIVPFLKSIVMCFESLAAQNKVDLVFHKEKDDILIYFDPEKLEKIITNLLSNAFNYTPEGGRITVSVRNMAAAGGFPRGCVEISVRDTGTGIPENQLPHIFDRFYRVEGMHEYKRKGSGIGLALTKELVELHHGEIEVQSSCRDDHSRGTEFFLRLPLGKEHLQPEEMVETVELEQRQVPILEEPGLLLKDDKYAGEEEETEDVEEVVETVEAEKEIKSLILVVDDNTDVRTYIRGSLEPYFKVVEAVDGKDGILRAKEIIPDLIVSDVMMPEIDGYELCRTLKNDVLTSHVPIILLTAKVSVESELEGLETGADDYITKPFSTAVLAVRVRNLIDLRRQLQLEQKNRMTLQPEELPVSPLDDKFYKKLQDTIETNLSDPDFNVEALSQTLEMSQATLYRKIHALTGQSPTLFLRSFRVKRAAQLLAANAGSVADVADKVGFLDKSYFAKCFKEQFNRLPSDMQSPVVSGTLAEVTPQPETNENNEKFLQGGPGGAVFSKSAPPGGRRQEIILVVEDSEDARGYIRESLETDYHVVEAVDGSEGIARAMEIIPDLIVSDIMMPGTDGYELCRVLKKDVRTCHIPIVLLTAKATEESMIRGLETGADDYITKPFNTNILLARIQNLIKLRSHLQNKRNREITLLPAKASESEIDREFLKELNAVIEKNLEDPEFNVDQLAKKLYMSSATLYRKIQALSGEIPSEYIRSYRLHRAAQLLKNNFGSITEVAFEVGFNSRTYFTKCFKEKFHQLPSVYMSAES